MMRLLAFPQIARALGVLLLVTAALKVHGLAADPIAGQGIFAAAELQLAVVEVEVLLALWLWGGA